MFVIETSTHIYFLKDNYYVTSHHFSLKQKH